MNVINLFTIERILGYGFLIAIHSLAKKSDWANKQLYFSSWSLVWTSEEWWKPTKFISQSLFTRGSISFAIIWVCKCGYLSCARALKLLFCTNGELWTDIARLFTNGFYFHRVVGKDSMDFFQLFRKFMTYISNHWCARWGRQMEYIQGEGKKNMFTEWNSKPGKLNFRGRAIKKLWIKENVYKYGRCVNAIIRKLRLTTKHHSENKLNKVRGWDKL